MWTHCGGDRCFMRLIPFHQSHLAVPHRFLYSSVSRCNLFTFIWCVRFPVLFRLAKLHPVFLHFLTSLLEQPFSPLICCTLQSLFHQRFRCPSPCCIADRFAPCPFFTLVQVSVVVGIHQTSCSFFPPVMIPFPFQRTSHFCQVVCSLI